MRKYFIERSVLPNGAQVVSDYLPEAHVARVELTFGMGSYHDFLKPDTMHTHGRVEQYHLNGLAHFSEHMAVGMHPTISPEDFRELLTDNGLTSGSSTNLWTSRDTTTYWAEGPKETLPSYFNFMAECMNAQAYRPNVWAVEQKRIVEEMAGYLTSPREIENHASRQAYWGRQISGQWVGGRPETLLNITLDNIRAHHERLHTSKNAILFTSGHIPHDEACAWAMDITAGLPGGSKGVEINSNIHFGTFAQLAPAHRPAQTQASIRFLADLSHEKTFPTLGPYFDELGRHLKTDVEETLGVYRIWPETNHDRDMRQVGMNIVTDQDAGKTRAATIAAVKAAVKAYETMTPELFEKRKRQDLSQSLNYEARNWFNVEHRINLLKGGMEQGDPVIPFHAIPRLEKLTRGEMLTNVEKILNACAITLYLGPTRDDYPDFKEIGDAMGSRNQRFAAQPVHRAAIYKP